MKVRALIVALILLVSTLACSLLLPKPEIAVSTFSAGAISFIIPEDWQKINASGDYYGLGVQKVVAIQGPAEPLPVAFFTVSTSPLAGGADLETRFSTAYENIASLQNVTKKSFTSGKLSGFEISYRRPWGESWWEFRDIWLEKDGVVYVLSFRAGQNESVKVAASFEAILASFHFKD